ncbi:hypothetical protein KUTeg_019384 [Tegillarca granosa]|uniref:alkaline phosphatase n=1 Tax=Tegillarca granosa TaxID=220873 RepID=A0ABQ9ECD1_TEGGR|nr:hypothetical protein KUTeg_019384 [Tegillarca granosa]
MVTTETITGGDTAPLYAESPNRSWEGDANLEGVEGGCVDVAKQFVFNNPNIKVAFGGGRTFFLTNTTLDPEDGKKYAILRRRDKLDLIKIFFKLAVTVKAPQILNRESTSAINISPSKKTIGLFSPF